MAVHKDGHDDDDKDDKEDYNDGNDDDDSVELLRSVQHYACLLKHHVLFLNQYFLYDNTTNRDDDSTVAITKEKRCLFKNGH